MKLLILAILYVIQAEVSSKKALVLNLETRAIVDVSRKIDDEEHPPYLAACPASTPQETQFNENFSLVKPTMLYNTEDDEYEIGYELYFEDGILNTTNKTYHRYRPVIAKSNKIMNLTIQSSDDLITKYEDEKDVKFSFSDGSGTLVFHWVEVLSIKSSSKHKKSIKLDYYTDLWWRKIENLQDRCNNYRSDDDDIYYKEKQKIYPSISVVPSLSKDNPDKGCGHPYGCLEKYQIAPIWFFDSSFARLASCSHMNIIPVWKSIAEQLRKVDLYILAILENLHASVTFGISGAVKMKSPTKNFNVTRKMYLTDAKNHRKVPISKILFRIIKISSKLLDEDIYTAAIIIHNDPTANPKVDKLCIDSTLSGWDKITNDDPSTGLTYVCRVTELLRCELGTYDDDLKSNKMQPLDLDTVPYYRNQAHQRIEYDETIDIDEQFEKFVNESKARV